MSAFDSGYQNSLDVHRLYTVKDKKIETGFKENFEAQADYFARELKSTSKALTLMPQLKEQNNLLRSLRGQDLLSTASNSLDAHDPQASLLTITVDGLSDYYKSETKNILELQKKHPDAGLKTYDQIMLDMQTEAATVRNRMHDVSGRKDWYGVAGNFAGMMWGAVQDPIVAASMLLGSGKIKGPSILKNAWKGFWTEAAIGAGSELMIQPFVYDWKAELNSPYSVQEAALTVLSVGGFAGVLRGGVGAGMDVASAMKASKSFRASGETAKADLVDAAIEMYENAPTLGNSKQHMDAMQKTHDAYVEGRVISQEEIDEVFGARAEEVALDPDSFDLPESMWNIKINDNSVVLHTNTDGDGNITRKWVEIKKGTNKDYKRSDFDTEVEWERYLKLKEDVAAEKARGRALIEEIRKSAGEPINTEFKIGTPIKLKELDDKAQDHAGRSFREPQRNLNLTPVNYRNRAKRLQGQIVSIGKELQEAMGESIAFLDPGIKNLSKITNKIKHKGYDSTGDLTDIIRAGFAVKEASDIPQIIEKISSRYEVLDEGIVVNAAGYIDQKLLVRFDNGLVGEIQLWSPHILAAKEGAEFVRDVFPKHLQEYVSDMNVPLRKDSGHDLYERQRSLLEDGEIKPGKYKEFKALEKAMKDLYAEASRFSKTSSNDALESGRPESRISNGEIFSHSPGLDDARINQPDNPPSGGSTVTAGRPSQLKNAETSLKSNKVISDTSTDIIPRNDTDGIHLGDENIKELMEAELVEAQRILDDSDGDFIIPISREDSRGQVGTDYVSAKKVFEDIAIEERVVNNLNLCMRGKGV